MYTTANHKMERKMEYALLACMEHQTFDNITISEICIQANINRSTFYRHFPSKDALLQKTYQHALEPLLGNLYRFFDKHHSIAEAQLYLSNHIFHYIYDNQFLYQTLLFKDSHFYFILKDFIQAYYLSFYEGIELINKEILTESILANYIASAYAGMIYEWVKEGCSPPPVEMAEKMRLLNSNGPMSFLIEKKKESEQ